MALIGSIAEMIALAPPELEIIQLKVSPENGHRLFAEFCEGQYVGRGREVPTSLIISGVLVTWSPA